MLKKITIFILLFFLTLNLSSQEWLWVKNSIVSVGSEPEIIRKDLDENVLLLIEFTGEIELADFDTSFVSYGEKDIVICETDKYGRLLWIKHYGNVGLDDPKGLYIDKFNNIFITGSFENTVDFDGTTITSTGTKDAFLLKLNPKGQLIFVKNIGGGDKFQKARKVITDGNKIFAIIFFYKDIIIGNDTIKGNKNDTYKNYLIARLDANGNLEAYQKLESSYKKFFISDIQFLNNKLYAAGFFTDTLMYNSDTIVSYGSKDILFLKLDWDLNIEWIKTFGDNNIEECWDIQTDDSYIYLSGSFIDSLPLADILLQSIDCSDMFIAKFNEDGIPLWARSIGGHGFDNIRHFDLKDNLIYCTGIFQDTIIWGNDTLMSSNGNREIYWGIINKAGDLLNSIYVPSNQTYTINKGVDIVVNNNNNIYLTGQYKSELLNFGEFNINNPTRNFCTFFAKYGCFEGVILETVDAGCGYDNNGQISVETLEGVGPFEYHWDNGLVGKNILGLTAGEYQVTVSKENCQVIDTGVINYHDLLAANLFKRDLLCYGDSDGMINVNIVSGFPPFHYNWSNNSTDTIIENLKAGDYFLTLTDYCPDTLNLYEEIVSPDSLEAYLTLDQFYNIFGIYCLAKVTVHPSGGIPDYHYLWSSDDTTQTVYLEADKYYTLTITDANGCQLSGWFYLPSCNKKMSENNFYSEFSQLMLLKNNVICYNESEITNIINIKNDITLIYPNPTNDYVKIYNNAFKTDVKIFDMLGKQKIHQIFHNNIFKINVSELKHGIYIIDINGKQQKLVIYH